MKRVLLPLLLLALCSIAFAQKADEGKDVPKLTAEEIIAKHTASIGTPEALAAVKTRILTGVGTFTAKNSPGKIGGPAQFATDRQKMLLVMVLNANDYPSEKVGFDGKEVTTATLPNGRFSQLAGFLKSNKFVVKRGLFGGVLNGGWPLLNPDKDVKFQYAGTVKVGDRNAYKLKFSSPGIGDTVVSLFFDAETFRHVRTEYFYRVNQIMTPNPDRPATLTSTAASHYTLTEDFSDFTKVDNVVLPLSYIIEYSSDAGKPVVWTVKFSQAYNNQPLEASVFSVS
jgi:hypothetical protein